MLNLPPLLKVRCCRPKKFGRLPEGLSLHQPFQHRTIPLAFRRVSVCVCLVGFASIAIVVVCGRCVLHRLFATTCKHPCLKPLGTHTKASLPFLPLPLHRPSPFLQPLQNDNNPSHRITSQIRTIPCFAPSHLPPLSKVRCCRPKKFGRLPERLPHHHLSLAPTLPKPHYPPRFS